MANFTGSSADETIAPGSVSATVIRTPSASFPGGAADSIDAGAGNDTIDSGGGSDSVRGGEGNDLIHLGSGDDLYTEFYS